MADTLVVAIDFGTTFSGVAAAYSANPEAPDELNIVKTWPGGNNITSDKVPSEITYNGLNATASASQSSQAPLNGKRKFDAFKDDSTPSNSGRMRWGYQIRPDEDRLRCLKLLLDPTQPIPDYVSLPDVQQQLLANGKNISTAVADYLRALYAHTKVILGRRYGQQFVATTKLTVILTVPAVWSDAAKDATLKAAEAAGMGDTIGMISDPEAAAVYTLQAIQPNHLKIGHNFVVIDAGGGTVDLISYSIRQLTPLRLDELAKGSGGFCGATFLNIRFEQFVRTKLGSTAFNAICTAKPKSWLMALKYFEDYVKRNFDPDEEDVFNIPFPGVPDNEKAGVEGGFLIMDTADVDNIFRPIVANIISLVEGQILQVRSSGAEVNGLLLVGGFGQSECLMKALQARFSTGVHKIEVMQPVNAWTAVVRGAVLRGLEGAEMVTTRKARRHYGVSCSELFDASRHPASCKKWDDTEEKWVADNRMSWAIVKGQTVSSTTPVLVPFYRTFVAGQSKTVTEELVISDADSAPSAFSLTPGSGTRVSCRMLVNLNTVPANLWEVDRNSRGKAYHRLNYKIGMQIESGGLRFDFRVDDVVYGRVNATFT
ncbi:hypothetical protein LTR17_002113 [Elasticomyces elasticus]|nr:hypothetical protein LTR17_002113 [Elasticomyces elasticus]